MCPEIDILRELIQGTLPDDDEAAVTDHLGDCQGCQYRFDQLAGPDEFVDRVPRMLSDSSERTVLDAALDELEAETSRGMPQYPSGRARHADTDEDDSAASIAEEFSPYGDVERWFETSDEPGALGSLAGYDIVGFIGRGGMGVVFRGRDRSLDRDVALKVLAPSLAANATARERFSREARSAAAINHSNVATVHSVEESGQLPCIAMEFIEGESLRQRLDHVGRLELKELIRIGYQVASGLDAAHAKGIVHRDIKPGNILLESSSQRVRLTDFGLARVTTDDTLTQTGLLVGTPGYIAPEVASGDEADHRADLFSLGCLLYVMATGTLPFQADSTMQSLRRVVEDAATPARELNPNLPEWLDELIRELLQKDPNDRPQTAADIKRIFKREYRRLKHRSASEATLSNSDVANSPLTGEHDSLSGASSAQPQRRSESAKNAALLPIWYAGSGAALLALALAVGSWLGGDSPSQQIEADRDNDASAISAAAAASDKTSDADSKVTSRPLEPIVVRADAVAATSVDGPRDLTEPDRQISRVDQPVPADVEAEPVDPPESAPRVVEPFHAYDDEEYVGSFESLDDAIHEADDGFTIVIKGDGPFRTEGITIHHDDLTIEAESGSRPVIQFVGDADSVELFNVSDSASFRGLELRVDDPNLQDDDDSDFALVRCRGTFQAINCRFVVRQFGRCLAAEHADGVELRNCELHAPQGHAVTWEVEQPGELQLHNCVVTAESAFFFEGRPHEFTCELAESTVLAGTAFWLSLEPIRLDDDEQGLHIGAELNVFDVDDALVVLEPEFGDPREQFEQTHWEGERNVFTGTFAALAGEDGLERPDDAPESVRDWAGLENVEELRSILHRVEYAGGRDAVRFSAFETPQGPPVQFRVIELPVFETYLRGTPGGNVDEIGPGPAWDFWLDEHDDD